MAARPVSKDIVRADFAPAHIGLAPLRIATGRIDEARKQLSSLQTADKDRADYLATLAKVDLASGQLSEAEQNITRAEGAGAPASELAFLKGELLLKKGDPKQAVAFLKKAKKSLPKDADLLVLCNINYTRAFLSLGKELGKPVATDVHAIADLDDAYNRDFMAHADILFMSHERLPVPPDA